MQHSSFIIVMEVITLKDRIIIHADLNHCYAQIEEMMFPELRNVPMAVGGDEESRHGIILAKNNLAKKHKIKTGESLREAYAKCPDLLIIHPNYNDYMYYTELVKDIYREYTDKVESFGLDEAWIELTGTEALFGDAIETAKNIQERVYRELGLMVSMGISYNKIFAKLGSDLDKNMGFTVITRDNFKQVVYPLPCDELLYVGQATKKKLNLYDIETIGDIAKSSIDFMKKILGKNGEMIWYFANGYDASEVKLSTWCRDVKSVGNSITAIRDMETNEDVRLVYSVLSESVASRLKDLGIKGFIITISMRNNKFQNFNRQRKIEQATNISSEILEAAMCLVRENCPINKSGYFYVPYRSIGISVTQLVGDTVETQLNFFVDEEERFNAKKVDIAMDTIRKRFGFNSIKKCGLLLDKELTDFNPKGDNIIHPESWF